MVGMQIGATTVESSVEIPQKLKMNVAFDTVIPLLGTFLNEKTYNLKEHKHSYVHCSIIYNHQDIEAAHMSIRR